MCFIITGSTKILTLETAPFLFTLVGTLCEFVMVADVYVLLPPQEEKRYFFFPDGTDVHIWQHIHQKYFNLCLPLRYYAKIIHLKIITVR